MGGWVDGWMDRWMAGWMNDVYIYIGRIYTVYAYKLWMYIYSACIYI